MKERRKHLSAIAVLLAIAIAGALFWKLVTVMARVQATERNRHDVSAPH